MLDTIAGIGSILPSFEELAAEVSDRFVLEMSWPKEKTGIMHGDEYTRRTLATVWRRRG